MSAFLGPIHYWLYNKIKVQQDIVEDIYALGKQHGLNIQEEIEGKYGTFDHSPLEQIIDPYNIHGWLQERVSQVEYKYAESVTELLKKVPTAKEELKAVLTLKGKERGQAFIDAEFNAPNLYQYISDNLLDGMPCDHANSLIQQDENETVWRRDLCVHEDYWTQVGGDINIYYELRDAWMEGFAKACGLEFAKLDDATYSFRKGV